MKKRVERSTDRVLEKVGKDGLLHLLSQCRDFECRGRGQECSQFHALRRARGIDLLYGAEGSDEEPEAGEHEAPDLGREPSGSRKSPSAAGARWPRQPSPTRPSTGASMRTGSERTSSRPPTRRRSSVLSNGNLPTKRAAEVLTSVEFFEKLEAQTPGVLAQLVVCARFQTEKAGQALFRQGDPPSAAYVVASGQVGIFKHKQSALAAAVVKKTKKRAPTPRDRFEPRMFSTLTVALTQKSKAREVNGVPRYATSEGFNTFFDTSMLGDQVAKLGQGGVFGERALQEDDVRAASAVCLQDTELLVIQSTVYKQVMRDSIEKVAFLNTHLHGIRSLAYAGAEKHPSMLFILQTFPEGHVFLHEGVVAVEPAVYVIRKGIVEFRRFSHASHSPARVLTRNPLPVGPLLTKPAPLKCGLSRSEGALGTAGAEGTPGAGAGEAVWDTLCEGDVFASLASFPLPSPEPFTAIATAKSGCQVYRAQGLEILALPVKLLRPLRRQLMRRLMTRLMRLPDVADSQMARPQKPSTCA